MRGPADIPAALLPSGVRSSRNPQEVASQFEALLMKEVVASMRRTVTLSGEEPSGGQLVDHLIEDALATHLAKSGGVGVAALVIDDVDEPQRVTPTTLHLQLDRWVRRLPETPPEARPTSSAAPPTAGRSPDAGKMALELGAEPVENITEKEFERKTPDAPFKLHPELPVR